MFHIAVYIVALCVVAVAFGPLVTIWALNLLFGLTIPMQFSTWFAVLWLCGTLRSVVTVNNNNK